MDKKMNMIGLTRNNSTWAYVRAIPKVLRSHPTFKNKKNYRRQLASIEVSREELVKVWEQAHTDFEVYIERLKQLNNDVIMNNNLIEQAERFLRMNGLSAGMLAVSNQAGSHNDSWSLEQGIEQSGVFDELFDHVARVGYQQAGSVVPIKQELCSTLRIQEQAWKLLNEPRKESYKLYLFSDCWTEYVAKKGLDTSVRGGKRVQACFDRFIELVGDLVLDGNNINDALASYVDLREQKRTESLSGGGRPSPSPASISRELNTLLAVLRVGCKKFRITANIERPQIKEDVSPRERHTFSTHEQLELVSLASDQSRTDYQPYKELMILLMIQTGTHVTELIRLKRNKVILDSDIPHMILDGELKTSQRKRVIPLVYKVKRIRDLAEHYYDSSDYFFGDTNASRTPDNYSAQLNKLCKEINPDSSSYSCRHAFKHLAYAKGVDAQVLAILGGWSGKEAGLSRQMQGYGKSGLVTNESLLRLQRAMLDINQHLTESEKGVENVTYLKVM